MKPAIWRSVAERDAAEAAWWYAQQAGLEAGERFLAAVEDGIAHISRHPATGSVRYAVALGIDGLRFWPLGEYPYLILYIELETHLDVLRVLHAQRDVPDWMGATKEPK
ncbi:MAG: type II toxin-antitoxin system RelE/ParE family toxin [Rhizobium sp.]|nr:type II toxin-antitoxin system RelE/ParE family toxin [Rhizobium sp.]